MDAAAKVISRIADWAREKADGTVATVGYVNTIPGGMNIVADTAEFTVDIRSRNNDNIMILQTGSERLLRVRLVSMAAVLTWRTN